LFFGTTLLRGELPWVPQSFGLMNFAHGIFSLSVFQKRPKFTLKLTEMFFPPPILLNPLKNLSHRLSPQGEIREGSTPLKNLKYLYLLIS
jgi:hypothetical protein